MSANAPHDPRTARKPAQRVAAPPTQSKSRRLPPAFTLAWLHLMPDAAFPIRSRDDMAAKISALLFDLSSRAEAQQSGHKLPLGGQSQSGR